MPTLEKLISLVQNPPDKGLVSRARTATKREIVEWINSCRAYLITKTIEKLDSFPVALEQDLGCWPLETVDVADCDCPYEWGDNVRKAVIPEVMEIGENKGISFFGMINKRTRIYLPSVIYGSLDDFIRFPLKGAAGYQAQMIGNQTIYVRINKSPDTPPIKVVNIRGVFKDPTLVSFYSQQGIEYCFDAYKTNYPIDGDLQDLMLQRIWSTYLMPFAQIQRDNSNQENNRQPV